MFSSFLGFKNKHWFLVFISVYLLLSALDRFLFPISMKWFILCLLFFVCLFGLFEIIFWQREREKKTLDFYLHSAGKSAKVVSSINMHVLIPNSRNLALEKKLKLIGTLHIPILDNRSTICFLSTKLHVVNEKYHPDQIPRLMLWYCLHG